MTPTPTLSKTTTSDFRLPTTTPNTTTTTTSDFRLPTSDFRLFRLPTNLKPLVAGVEKGTQAGPEVVVGSELPLDHVQLVVLRRLAVEDAVPCREVLDLGGGTVEAVLEHVRLVGVLSSSSIIPVVVAVLL